MGLNPQRHIDGREALLDAWPQVTGEVPSLAELQMAGAVAAFESAYGHGTFHDLLNGIDITDSNNWGAVMCNQTPPCDPDLCFEATDHGSNFVTPDNTDGAFQACFKKFATPAEGAAVFIHNVTKQRPLSWAAMKTGNISTFSDAMFREHYYGGLPVNAPPEVRIANHAKAVNSQVEDIAAALGEPIAATLGGSGLSLIDAALGGVVGFGVLYLLRHFRGG